MSTKLKRYQKWWRRNWRKSLLLSVTVVGMCAMGWFKITASHDTGPAFISLVLFTEVAAGIAVFAQALLRRVNETAANKAFRYSVFARGVMAIIGLALFAETGTLQRDLAQQLVAPYWLPGTVSVTAFLTYEVGNGLMLLIEWMFSHLLAFEDSDARAIVVKLETAKKKLAKKVKRNAGLIQELQEGLAQTWVELGTLQPGTEQTPVQLAAAVRAIVASLEETRATLAPAAADNGDNTGHRAPELDTLPVLAQHIMADADRVKHEHGQAQAALGAIMATTRGNGPRQLEALPADVQAVIVLIKEMTAARQMVEEMKGRPFTIAPNRQAFYCTNCGTRNEKGRTAQPICKKCNHHQTKK